MARPLITVVAGAFTFAATLSFSHALLQPSATAQAAPASQPIAVVHSIGILRDLLIAEGHNEALQAEEQQFRTDRVIPLQNQMSQLEQQFAQAQAAGQDTQVIAMQYQQMQQALQGALQQLQEQLIRKNDDAMMLVYRNMRDAAREVCEEMGYAYSIACEDPAADFADTPGSVANQNTSRILVASPDMADITDAVRERLGIPATAEAQDEGEAPGEAAPDAGSDG